MAAAFKKGDAVRQVVTAPIAGNVSGFHVDQETGEVQYLVVWNEGGEEKSRYFTAEQLEAADASS